MTTETTGFPALSGAAYRIQHPTLPLLLSDMSIPATDPGPGDRAPVIDLPTTTGDRLNTKALARDGRPLFLVFGSLTCPITEGAADGIKDLHRRYGDRIRFVLVNVREAHPGGSVPQPQNIKEKAAHAKALAAVAADRLPRTADVRRTLHSVVQMAGHGQVSLATAGKGALRDTWRAAPPIAVMIQTSRLFSFLPRHRRGVPAVATMLALGLLAVTAVAVIL